MLRRLAWVAVAAALGGAITAAVVLAGPGGRSGPTGGPAGVGPTPTETNTPEPTATETPISTPAYAAYADFLTLSAADLATLQVKITHVGDQSKPVGSVIFSPAGALDPSKFVPFRRPGFSYDNDDTDFVVTFEATAPELQAMLKNLSGEAAVTGGGVAAAAVDSFAMVASTSLGDIGFESILDRAETATLLSTIASSLDPGNAGGLEALRVQWVILDLGIGALDPDTDGDGLSTSQEFEAATDPANADTDGDGVGDGAELSCGSNPLNPDSRCP